MLMSFLVPDRKNKGRAVMRSKVGIVFGVALFLFTGVLYARDITVYRYQCG